MKKSARRGVPLLVISAFLILQILPYLPASMQSIPLVYTLKKASLFNPPEINAVGLSTASATLSNPRLSFDTVAGATTAIGGQVITVNGTSSGDTDTRNIFPNDSAVVVGNSAITVASVSADLVTFTLRTPLTAAATLNTTHIYVAQTGTISVQFYTANSIPVGGSFKISVPAPSASGSDGVPVAATSVALNGFDSNSMTNANVTCPGGFTAGTFTAGTGGAPHTITCNNSGGAVPSGANLTTVIGSGANPLVNPATTIGRTSGQRGIADIYTVAAGTYSGTSGAGSLIEDAQMRVAPVEGVLVSATVDETLSFTVAGVNIGSTTYCGTTHTAGLTTTATSVPWGILSSGYNKDKNEAVQQLIVTTNATGGYKVYGDENDQMGDEGAVCTGAHGANSDNPSSGDYTFSGKNCIRDVAGGTNNALFDWLIWSGPPTAYGFGYAVDNSVGSDAGTNLYTTGGKAFGARAFTDIENTSETRYAAGTEMMYNSGPVSASTVNVCYRILIPATQPAGFYYNKVRYTAIPKF